MQLSFKLEKQSDADHLSPVSVCCLHIRGVPTGRLRSPLLVKLSPNNSDIDSPSCYGVTKNLVQSCSNLSHLAAFEVWSDLCGVAKQL
jgi:hypothetical protein